jgi:hypothetical protein
MRKGREKNNQYVSTESGENSSKGTPDSLSPIYPNYWDRQGISKKVELRLLSFLYLFEQSFMTPTKVPINFVGNHSKVPNSLTTGCGGSAVADLLLLSMPVSVSTFPPVIVMCHYS